VIQTNLNSKINSLMFILLFP